MSDIDKQMKELEILMEDISQEAHKMPAQMDYMKSFIAINIRETLENILEKEYGNLLG